MKLKETVSWLMGTLQGSLFPAFEECFSTRLTYQEKQLIKILDISKVEKYVPRKAGNEVKRIEKKTKKGDKEVVKQVPGIEGLEGTLIPPALIIQEYLAKEQKAIDGLEAEAETLNAEMEELREEHGGEDGLMSNAVDDKQKISRKNLQQAIKDLGKLDADNAEEYDMLQAYKKLMDDEADAQSRIKAAKADLEKKVITRYPALSIDEIKPLW